MRGLLFAALAALPAWTLKAQLVRVIDGDTFVARLSLRPGMDEERTIRLPCGNAAELREDGGMAAREALSQALNGSIVVQTQWSAEKYGRLLASPYRERADGGFDSVCAELRDGGWLR